MNPNGDQPLERLRKVLAEKGWDAMMARDTANIRWLTGFEKVFDTEAAHCLLVTPERAILHTDSRYSNAAREAAERLGGGVAIDEERKTHAAFVAETLSEFAEEARAEDARQGRPPRLAIENTISLAEYRRLEKVFAKKDTGVGMGADATECATGDESGKGAGSAVELVETDRLVVGLRACKNNDELDRMRAAQAITDAAFVHIVDWLQERAAVHPDATGETSPGLPTEREVQLELDRYMLDAGAEGLAFATIVATGAHAANPHAIPGETRLNRGDAVVMDFGAIAKGYCSDMTRTIFIGEPDEELRRAYEALRRANETVEARLSVGMTGIEAHELAERVLAEGGFEGRMGHGLGHGVGLEVHEEPCLNSRNDKPLPEGAVVTVEPGIYVPSRFGMRLEDCGVITAEGYRPFTQSTHEMVIIR